MHDPNLKAQLLAKCLEIQQEKVDTSHKAMLQAQASANDQKGTMGDKFESFREQMQIDRDMYARQFDEGSQVLSILKRIDPEKTTENVALGAIVITDSQNFFVSASLGNIELEDKKFVAISSQSPMYKAMASKKKGEKFSFREKTFIIKEIY